MSEMFFSGTGIAETLGVIRLVREGGKNHEVSMAELADATGMNIDDLLPIIEACRMLGFTKVSHGVVRLTPDGSKLNQQNFHVTVRAKLRKIEPFKTTVKMLSEYDRLNTKELSELLYHEGISLEDREGGHTASLRKLLIRWAVGCGLLEYNHVHDRWRLKASI